MLLEMEITVFDGNSPENTRVALPIELESMAMLTAVTVVGEVDQPTIVSPEIVIPRDKELANVLPVNVRPTLPLDVSKFAN